MHDNELYQQLLGLTGPWSVERVELHLTQGRVDVYVTHEPKMAWRCPTCQEVRGLYDHSPERVWRHLDSCQYKTLLHARLPRITCPLHGVLQVSAPWAEGNASFTLFFEKHLIQLLQACDTQAAATLSSLSWDQAWLLLERAVERGVARKPHRVPIHMGVDEKSFGRWHRYETLVYDLDQGTVDYVADDRTEASLAGYFQQFSAEELAKVEAVALDMWEPYQKAVRAAVPEAEKKMVFDRYHIMDHVLKAVDAVRRQEHRHLHAEGCEILSGTRYLWLWNEENVPEERREEFERLRALDLHVARAAALKENVRHLWDYRRLGWAQKFFRWWYFWATHSRLKPIIKVAKMLKNHLANILTYVQHRITNAVAEGINSKIEKVKKMACGFRNRKHYRLAILFHCGGLDLFPRASEPLTPTCGGYP